MMEAMCGGALRWSLWKPSVYQCEHRCDGRCLAAPSAVTTERPSCTALQGAGVAYWFVRHTS